MFKRSSICDEESCQKAKNPMPTFLFQCTHHCNKMLCIKHLDEHESCSKDRKKKREQLNNLWNEYETIFDENRKQIKAENLRRALYSHEQLRGTVNRTLSMDECHASIEENETLDMLIEIVLQQLHKENRSSSFSSKLFNVIQRQKEFLIRCS